MTRGETTSDGSEKRPKGVKRARESTKYTRYTEEQIEVLEKIYAKWTSPNSAQRAQILDEEPALKGIENKHLKVWFQNRRSREKHRKGNDELAAENKKLTIMYNHLKGHTDSLAKKVAELDHENGDLRNQFLTVPCTINVGGRDIEEASAPELSIRIDDLNKEGLLLLATEIKTEFTFKAIGKSVDWISFPMKKVLNWMPNPDSVYPAISISYTCIGVAARARNITVHLDLNKTIDILKDKLSWSRYCRNMIVIAKYTTENGETIELISTQYYSLTTMARPRDFWTLRYTCPLKDGSVVVCERSVSSFDDDAVPSSPTALEYVRARMLTSGYWVRPCKTAGSIVQVIQHLDFEASSVPEVARPLYQSSELVAKKMVLPALQYLEHVASEANDKRKRKFGEGPTFFRKFGDTLSRAFNDAVHGSSDDGWTLMNVNAPDDVYMFIKGAANSTIEKYDGVICTKASLHLQDVYPASFMKFLKERRLAWIRFNFGEICPSYSGASCFPFPVEEIHDLSDTSVLLGNTNYEDEILEVIRFERLAHHKRNFSSRDLYHLQITNGLEDTEFGACSELIFAPIHRTLPNDAILFSSGFRMILLPSNTNGGEGTTSSATNLTSNEASNTTGHHPHSIMTLAFQFPYESHLQDEAIAIAMPYMRHVIANVKNLCLEMTLSRPVPPTIPTEENSNTEPNLNPDPTYAVDPTTTNLNMRLNINPSSSDAVDPTIAIPDSNCLVDLASLMCQSYRSSLGVELVCIDNQNPNLVFNMIQHHQHAVLCFSFSSNPVCLYANLSAFNMLETTAEMLSLLFIDKILDSTNDVSLYSILPTLTQQGYIILPRGYCLTEMKRLVTYEQAVVWLVYAQDGSIHCFASAFINWSFVPIV